MHRRLVPVVALAAAAGVLAVPAEAAKKPRVIRGSYHVTTNPNPTIEATEEVSNSCDQTVPGGADDHAFTVPGRGTLHVLLQGADPTGSPVAAAGPDWDLFVLDSDGSVLDSSTGAGAREETTDRFKKKQRVTLQACNLAGTPDATVSWTFTYG